MGNHEDFHMGLDMNINNKSHNLPVGYMEGYGISSLDF
jgi:hypothetical protein